MDMRKARVPDLLDAARTLERQVVLLLRDAGLTLAQFRVLRQLDSTDPCSACTLSVKLGITKPSTTSLVQGMRALGLVAVHPHPVDRRSVLVGCTKHGIRRLEVALQNLEAMEQALQAAPSTVTRSIQKLTNIPTQGHVSTTRLRLLTISAYSENFTKQGNQ